MVSSVGGVREWKVSANGWASTDGDKTLYCLLKTTELYKGVSSMIWELYLKKEKGIGAAGLYQNGFSPVT